MLYPIGRHKLAISRRFRFQNAETLWCPHLHSPISIPCRDVDLQVACFREMKRDAETLQTLNRRSYERILFKAFFFRALFNGTSIRKKQIDFVCFLSLSLSLKNRMIKHQLINNRLDESF